MAKKRTCAGCSNLTRIKYRFCNECRERGVTTATTPNPNDVILSPEEDIAQDQAQQKQRKVGLDFKRKYEAALKLIDRLECEARTSEALHTHIEPVDISPKERQGTSEATPVIVASDWHIEELVGDEVGGLNTYTPEIAATRATEFFRNALRLVTLLNQDVAIHTVVLALLGDFITGNIHGEENAETNELTPTHALVTAQNMLISGVEFLLAHTPYEFILPCHSGNHARTTVKTRFGAENGHSLEYLMYLHLATYFRHEPRVRFIVSKGMHSYLSVYDQTVRFQHGHAIKYMGGVGGIYIPVNKAIAQWNKARHADLDVFGHFHQMRDGGNFICNGSMIGYNAFALSIKADYEEPKQALFLLDKKRGRTATWPVLFSR